MLYHTGIDGVVDDATNPTRNGIISVLQIFTEILKNYILQKHIKRVEYRYIDSAGWQMRNAMTEILFDRFYIPLTEPMNKWPIEQLSGCLFELIQKAVI